jgi:hypothetical protein
MEIPNTVCPICNGIKKPKNKYCSFSCRNKAINANRNYKNPEYLEKMSKFYENRSEKLSQRRYDDIVACKHCKKEFVVVKSIDNPNRGKKLFCSTSCANSFKYSDRIYKEKLGESISNGMKRRWNDLEYRSHMAEVQSHRKQFTSKTEKIIREYFINNYPEEEWTYGGSLKIEDEYISRDLYSNSLKICFEFDGIFHFKKIFAFEKKRKKDILLEKWCSQNDYVLIRMSDSYFDQAETPLAEIRKAIEDRMSVKFYTEKDC